MKPLTPVAPGRRLALGIAFFIVFVAGWSLATFGGFVSKTFLADPVSMLRSGYVLLATQGFGWDIGWTVWRVFGGFAIAAVLALPLGVAMGAYKPVEAFFEPFVSFARYLPASAFIPLLILWAGIGEAQKLALIFIGSFFQLVLMVAVIVGNTRRDLVEAAYTLGVGDRGLIRRVLLPGAAPEIAEVLRMVLGWAWTYVIVAELIGASSGIGHMITDSQALLATDQIIFGIIVIGVIGLVSDMLFKGLNRRLFPWAQLGAMNALSIIALAFAMSTDAFAAAIGKGAALQRPDWREALRAGAIFGTIEALTPLVGWLLGSAAVRYVAEWDHWIAFTLLAALGAHMVWAGLRPSGDDTDPRPTRHSFWNLATTGFATSIDAMAVGLGLAFVEVNIVWVAAAIGAATFVMVTSGIMLGRALGAAIGKRAEVAGGVVLIAVGAAIVYEHLHG